jgi:hypothetical protein
MEFQSYKSEMPLFMIKDYWTKISTECYLILAVFLVIFLFFCRGSAWVYQFLGAVTFLVGILFINKHKFLNFYSDRIEYNSLCKNYNDVYSIHKSVKTSNFDKIAIYKFSGLVIEDACKYNANITRFKKFLLLILSYALHPLNIICFSVLKILKRIDSINLNVLILLDSTHSNYFAIPLTMLSEYERVNLKKYLKDKLNLNLDNIEVRDRFIDINFI